jgi:hypothetical protein
MSPQEKRHGVMARIRTSDLTVERPTLYHLGYPAIILMTMVITCLEKKSEKIPENAKQQKEKIPASVFFSEIRVLLDTVSSTVLGAEVII